MTAPHCLVLGGGRMAGGFVAPVLHDAGWQVTLAARDPDLVRLINETGGIWLRTVGRTPTERWIGGVDAISLDPGNLSRAMATADLVATAVGPGALPAVGAALAPHIRHRLEQTGRPLNLIAFENHRQAPELLMLGMIDAEPCLAAEVGCRLGLSGSAVWRVISRREVAGDSVRFFANEESECYVDAVSLLAGSPPLDNSTPAFHAVRSFDDRMIEKLWLFNAGHCAAAYFGWHAGYVTLDTAIADRAIEEAVERVVAECRAALSAFLAARPWSVPLPPRATESIVDCYRDPALNDPVSRVAREPRRKLAIHDRLIGPALALLSAGIQPAALANAAAAALAYDNRDDQQAVDLQRELELLGPEEVLAAVSGIAPTDELTALISGSYRQRTRLEVAS